VGYKSIADNICLYLAVVAFQSREITQKSVKI